LLQLRHRVSGRSLERVSLDRSLHRLVLSQPAPPLSPGIAITPFLQEGRLAASVAPRKGGTSIFSEVPTATVSRRARSSEPLPRGSAVMLPTGAGGRPDHG
jgi:hypothetical protein